MDGEFPVPQGTVDIPFGDGDFEASDRPPSWPAGGEVVTAADALKADGTRESRPQRGES